jgi:hypothetical protein
MAERRAELIESRLGISYQLLNRSLSSCSK